MTCNNQFIKMYIICVIYLYLNQFVKIFETTWKYCKQCLSEERNYNVLQKYNFSGGTTLL